MALFYHSLLSVQGIKSYGAQGKVLDSFRRSCIYMSMLIGRSVVLCKRDLPEALARIGMGFQTNRMRG